MIDIDNETNELMNEIYLKTVQWEEQIRTMQLSSKLHGLKVQTLKVLLDRITDLQDFCVKE